MVVPLNNTYISLINAFRSDCEELLDNFKGKCSEDFRDFVPLWKSLKFNLIYEKYTDNFNVHYDFKEDTLQIAKLLMLRDNFVGGMFLLYGLYYIQEDPKPCIRLDYSEFKKIVQLLRVQSSTSVESCQPGYLFAKLLKNDAFAFVRFSREFSMERLDRTRMIFNGHPRLSAVVEERQVKPKQWLKEFLGKIDIVEDLKKIERDYQSKTHKLKEEHPELCLSLDMVPSDLIGGLQKTLTQTNTEFLKPLTIGEKRKRIRYRKMETKRRYDAPSTSKQESCLPAQAKKRGGPTGQYKLYYKAMVNEPDGEKPSESDSDPDEPKFSLPNID